MNTIAQEFIQQGMEQGMERGMQKGIQQGIRQSILDLLDLRFNDSKVMFQEQVNDIRNLDDLQLLLRRAATVESVAQFLQALATL